MTTNEQITNLETTETENSAATTEQPAVEGEFKVSVRKLEIPVRPRGVLAE